MNLPFYIQKAVDLGLLEVDDGKICGVNESAVETVMASTRLVEKLQPTTIAEREDTLNQEAIVLGRVLTSASGLARELWSQLRTAFGVGHGQELPENLWSSLVFRSIGREIDLTFIGERTGKTISKDSIITGYESIIKNNNSASFSDFCETISELADKDILSSYGDPASEWNTALDILKQKRVFSLFKETIYLSNQFLKTDPNLSKALEFLHDRTLEGIAMLSGSIGNQGQVVDLVQSIIGDPGAGRLNWADYIINAKVQDQPVSTGVPAFDLDIEGGVAPPRPHTPRAGRLMIVAARTGVGKTALGVHVAASLAKGGLTVGFLSAELEIRSIEARLIANLSKSLISPYHWRRTTADKIGHVTVGELELPGATQAQERIAQIAAEVSMRLDEVGGKMLIEAPWGACVDTCINTMRSMKAKSPELRAVVLDHFHALARHKGGSASNPSAMLEDRAYKLMTAAKELDIDLFVLAQLNRVGMDSTSNAEPQLNEIRGTDALAHVSHATWLVRRVKSDNDKMNRDLEVWHSKVRGRQALWKEGEDILESIKGFHEKSIIRIDYETASVEADSTISDIENRKRSSTSII
ncbi:MAG: DnaB-like helicase C-terminal domain-containing protein [Candidatus Nanopelagicaceae bacterium]